MKNNKPSEHQAVSDRPTHLEFTAWEGTRFLIPVKDIAIIEATTVSGKVCRICGVPVEGSYDELTKKLKGVITVKEIK